MNKMQLQLIEAWASPGRQSIAIQLLDHLEASGQNQEDQYLLNHSKRLKAKLHVQAGDYASARKIWEDLLPGTSGLDQTIRKEALDGLKLLERLEKNLWLRLRMKLARGLAVYGKATLLVILFLIVLSWFVAWRWETANLKTARAQLANRITNLNRELATGTEDEIALLRQQQKAITMLGINLKKNDDIQQQLTAVLEAWRNERNALEQARKSELQTVLQAWKNERDTLEQARKSELNAALKTWKSEYLAHSQKQNTLFQKAFQSLSGFKRQLKTIDQRLTSTETELKKLSENKTRQQEILTKLRKQSQAQAAKLDALQKDLASFSATQRYLFRIDTVQTEKLDVPEKNNRAQNK